MDYLDYCHIQYVCLSAPLAGGRLGNERKSEEGNIVVRIKFVSALDSTGAVLRIRTFFLPDPDSDLKKFSPKFLMIILLAGNML
jgi:hypothetical protein